MGALDTALDTIFCSELGLDASYTPQNGSPTPIRVIMVAPEVLTDLGKSSKLQQQAVVFEIRASDVAAPRSGDNLTVANVQYRVMNSMRKDPRQAVWSVEAAAT